MFLSIFKLIMDIGYYLKNEDTGHGLDPRILQVEGL